MGAVSSGPVTLRVLTPLDRENLLRARLGLLALGERLAFRTRLWGWLGPLLMTLFGGALRLINLSQPDRIYFDETYYVKDAFTLDLFGFTTKWDPVDTENRNQFFNQFDYREMTNVAAYVVHGELGKWFIALGMRAFPDSTFGWRIAGAVAGTLMIMLLGRIAFRLFRSAQLATLAAGFVAIDGVGITLSRIALLDVFLALLMLAGFWAVLRDRDSTRARLAHRAAQDGWWENRLGPRLGFRGWLIVAGVFIGASAGVKWSGFYAAAALGLAVWLWDMRARRLADVPSPAAGSVLRGGLPAFIALVPAVIAAYVATWFSWFTHPDSYMHQWAAKLREAGKPVPRDWLPDTLNSFVEYHLKMYEFHSNLTSEHSYQAHPLAWLLQIRPTSFYWQTYEDQDQRALCGADRCIGAITSLGNPFIWWGAAASLVLIGWMWWKFREPVAGVILAGYAATYLPWLVYGYRTIFQFYTIAILPFTALALTYGIRWLWNHEGEKWRRRGRKGIKIWLGLVLFGLVFWWTSYTGIVTPYWFWQIHIWMPGWA